MTWRYEIKFVLDEPRMPKFVEWIGRTPFLHTAYPSRAVNSIYWDTPDMRAARENLDGIAQRRKYRFRWYGDDPNAPVTFETKIREGRFGRKQSVPVSENASQVMRQARPRIPDKVEYGSNERLNAALHPVLSVRYHRDYLIWRNRIRLTVDREIGYAKGTGDASQFWRAPVMDGNAAVLEFKFAPEEKAVAESLIATLPFYPLRHSKYLKGLSLTGHAVYI